MRKRNNMLFCFSPPVMLATFVVEICLLVYSLWRYKFSKSTRIVALMLLFLAMFQLAEYMLCGGLGWTGIEWARFGYVSITVLPPLGLHLAIVIAKKKLPWLIALAYGSMALFIYFFVFVTRSMNGAECRPNYAVFNVHDVLVWFYVLYYYGWLIVTTLLAYRWSRKNKYSKQLKALAVGYTSFIMPTTILNIINPSTVAGIPSIMCGFAILMALTLTFFVLPGTTKRR